MQRVSVERCFFPRPPPSQCEFCFFSPLLRQPWFWLCAYIFFLGGVGCSEFHFFALNLNYVPIFAKCYPSWNTPFPGLWCWPNDWPILSFAAMFAPYNFPPKDPTQAPSASPSFRNPSVVSPLLDFLGVDSTKIVCSGRVSSDFPFPFPRKNFSSPVNDFFVVAVLTF